MGRAIHEFKIPTKNSFTYNNSNIAHNLRFTNSSVHKYVQCRQTTKKFALEIK